MTLTERMQESAQDDAKATKQSTPRGTSEVLKIAAHSRPSAVAGAIAGIIREGGLVEIQSIGDESSPRPTPVRQASRNSS